VTTPDPFLSIPHLYHFTDRRNLGMIRQYGGLWPLASLKKGNVVIPAAGGNDWSHDADERVGMDRYVHLCFRNSHPMEYSARQDGRITDSIFLRIHPAVLAFPGVMFTDDVSNKSGVVAQPIANARTMIDFQILYTRTEWSDPAIMERLKRAEKCEVLVPQQIPLNYIGNMPDG
jgi:hypothetical protein